VPFTSLDCDRLSVELRLTASGERGGGLERELRGALESKLAAELAGYGDGREEGTRIFIDQLVVDGDIGGAWDIDRMVRVIASRIALTLERRIEEGDGLRFRDRVEFLAAFVVALAAGTAWGRWCFEEFDGLKAMSASNAIRSLVLIEEDRAVAAFARLTPGTCRQVVDALTPADAARVLACVRMGTNQTPPELLMSWKLARGLARDADAAPREWLSALIACERTARGGDTAFRVLQSMRALQSILDETGLELDGPAAGEVRGALRDIQSRSGLKLEWLSDASDAFLIELASDSSASRVRPSAARRDWTEHGGLLLLLGTMARLGWFDAWREEPAELRALAVAISATALLPAKAVRATFDPSIQLATGTVDIRATLLRQRVKFARLLRALGFDDCAAAQSLSRRPIVGGKLGVLMTGAAARLLAEFGASLPGLAGSSEEYLRRNALTLPAVICAGEHGARVGLGRASLDVLLTLSGRKRSSFVMPGAWRIDMRAEEGL
jgi:hypothetical protein